MTIPFDADQVVAPLAAFSTVPSWLAAGMDADQVAASLRRHVPELARGRLHLVSCMPDRLRARETEWLARYTVRVAEPRGDERDVVLVGNLWPPSVRPVGYSTGDGTGFGEPGWHCVLPELRLSVRVQDRDPALTALPDLVEPERATRLLQPVLRAAGYHDATITSCRPVVARYKPGSRCTVVVHLTHARIWTGPEPPSLVVLKTHQGDEGESAWAAMKALWDHQARWRHAVTLAEPLGYLPEVRILVQGRVPGESTLKEVARAAVADGDPGMLDGLRDDLANTARALAAMHGSGASYGRTVTFEDELADVTEVVERLSFSVPALHAAARPLLQRLTDLSTGLAPDPVVSAHHDFRPAHVLLNDGGVGFIDFDGACMAEPAFDLGRFCATLRDVGISALGLHDHPLETGWARETLPLLDDLCEGFLEEYQKHAAVSRGRVLLWETCDLLTTLLHAWTQVRLFRLEPRLTILEHQLRTTAGLT